MATFEDAAAIALTLPAAFQNGAALEVNGKGFAWTYNEKIPGRKGRVPRLEILAIRVASLADKDALLAADPAKFFDTEHYHGFPAILVRLALIDREELRELLIDGWRTRAPKSVLAEFERAQRRESA